MVDIEGIGEYHKADGNAKWRKHARVNHRGNS